MTRRDAIDNALADLKAGDTYRAVSARYGIAVAQLHRLYHDAGLGPRPPRRMHTKPHTLAAARLMIEQGMTINAACAATGASKGAVSVARRRLEAGRVPV